MKIKIIDVGSRDLDALLERVYQRAVAYAIPREEAVREALREWLDRTSEQKEPRASAVLEATPAELDALKAVLAAMRGYLH